MSKDMNRHFPEKEIKKALKHWKTANLIPVDKNAN
jgi:hypothetical protein